MEGRSMRFKPLRPRACDACRKRKVRNSKFWLESTLRAFQHCLSPAHVFRYAAMALRLLGGIARIVHLLVVRSRSFSLLTASTMFDHAYPPPLSFSDVHFYHHVQKTCAYKVIHGVSRDTPPDDAALARKGASPHGRNAPPIYCKLTAICSPSFLDVARYACRT